MIDAERFDAGIRDLERTAEADGTFSYTFFKGVGRKTADEQGKPRPATVLAFGGQPGLREVPFLAALKRVRGRWISPTYTRSSSPMSQQSFADLGVSKTVVRALAARGIEKPFAVQKLVIADILAGHDVLAQSPTGSGKTLAFGVPLADMIDAESRRPAALVLAPTRELACQIVDEVQSICNERALSVAAVYGGVGIQAQAKRAARAHIVVATPGRLEDLLQRGAISLKHVRMLVLDEADRMLDMGFKPAVDRIVSKVPARAPDAVLLRHARGRGRARWPRPTRSDARRHEHRPGARAPGRHRAPLRAPRPPGQARARSCASSSTTTAAARWSSCAPSAAPTGWSSA